MNRVWRFHPLLVLGGLTLVGFLAHAIGLSQGIGQVLLTPIQLTGLGLLAAGAPFTPLLGLLALGIFLLACLLLDRAFLVYFQSWAKATKRSWPN